MTQDDQLPETLLSQILPAEPLKHSSTGASIKDDFKPWHLPRKQHVRKKQWGDALERLIDNLPDRQMINYLCLPGEDLLDVQVLANVCRLKRRRLQYIGFDIMQKCASRSMQRVAAEQILRQTDVVEDTSEVIPDDFASIARCNSLGSRRLRDGGSYDVVNLDMCDAFTSHPQSHNHDAVLELLNHQSHHRGSPWLLFLTTHAETTRLQQREIQAYDQRIHENILQSTLFRECIARMLSVSPDGDVDALVARLREQRTSDSGLSGRWLALAIGKWLLGIMSNGAPWRVDILSVYCYRTGLLADDATQYASEPPNLFSLAFRLEKIRQVRDDPAGLATSVTSPGSISEADLAQKMATCIERNTLDLDCYLQSNAAMSEDLAIECESMLEMRNYSKDAYRRYLRRLPPITYSCAAATGTTG